MSIDQVRNAPTKQGWGWLNNQDNPRIRRTFDPDELKYLVRADSEIQFKRTSPGSNTFYGVGSDLRILDDTANNRFLVRSSRNDQLLIFGYSGLLAETSTVGWFGSGKTGFTYTYAGGQLDYMISPDGQGYKIDFNYDLHFWISELG